MIMMIITTTAATTILIMTMMVYNDDNNNNNNNDNKNGDHINIMWGPNKLSREMCPHTQFDWQKEGIILEFATSWILSEQSMYIYTLFTSNPASKHIIFTVQKGLLRFIKNVDFKLS